MKAGRVVVTAVVAAVAVLASLASAACGDGSDYARAATENTGAASRSALATRILGHEPAGLAQAIVDAGTVIVADDPGYPWWSSAERAADSPAGFDVDVARGMGEALGLKVAFEHAAWETVPAGLEHGDLDVFIGSTIITVERAKDVNFTEPYYYTAARVVMRDGGGRIATSSDLDGKTVGVCAGTTYFDFLMQTTTAFVKTYGGDADAFMDLANGSLDYVMTAGPAAQQAIHGGQPFALTGPPMYYENRAFAVKKSEGDWLVLLDYSIARMRKDGTLAAMSGKWHHGLDLTVTQ